MRNRSIFSLLTLCVLAFLLSNVTGNRALADQTVQPVGFSCVVYASNEESSKDSQLVAIDVRTQEISRISHIHKDYNLEGLAINPASQTLYAISGQSSPFAGNLYTVDLVTGELNLVGDTGFKKLSGLAIQPANATLWSWEKGQGLVQIDPTTAASTLQFSSPKSIEDITWSPDGSLLYAIQGKSLYIYTPQNGTFERVATNLPANTKAAEIRPDGLLLLSQKQDDAVHLLAYDPTRSKSVMDMKIRGHYDDIEAIAWPSTCGNASPGGEADFIQSVTIDKSQICSGESVLISAIAEHPESPNNPVDISINGDWGQPRYLQFTGKSGIRRILVTAVTAEKYIDSREEQIEVIECNASLVLPLVGARMNQFQDLVVDIDILNASEFEAGQPSYIWEFGDGQTLTTTTPFVSHDYSAALEMEKFYTVFQAKVTVHRDGFPDVSTPKTLTVWNMYAFNKRQGIIQPRVTYDPKLITADTNFVGPFSARNFESEPIHFTSRQIELDPCDPNQDPIPLPVEDYLLELAPNQELTTQIEIPVSVVPADVCDIAVYLTGSTATKTNAYMSLYFAVKKNDLVTGPVEDAAMEQLLNDISERGLVEDPYHISEAELYDLARAGKITYPPLPVSASANKVSPLSQQAAIVQQDSGDPCTQDPDGTGIICQPCVPEETPPRPGITCQITGGWERTNVSHIMNAHKGDIIVGVSCSPIHDLLRRVSVTPGYSHTGIMTQNYYQISHSTASIERYVDHAGSNGIPVNIIKYGWPGTITQSMDQAFNGEDMSDPENPKKNYTVSGFAPSPRLCPEDTQILYPKVVKPLPGSDPSVRRLLQAAADAASQNIPGHIHGHYRFFGYTDGSISETPNFNGPAKSGWAKETLATVCTTFIWTALRSVGINTIEGALLEPTDYTAGAARDASTLDGLYVYTEAERKSGGQWLYDHFWDLAYEKAGFWGTLLTGAPDKIASEIANCFANDTCDKGSWAWGQPGIGRSVSPDNILLYWDSPQTGGVYGYNENLIYRPAGYQAVTTWQPSEGVGSIEGQVLINDDPVPGASVTILNLELFTDEAGHFQDNLIPAGTYGINATAMFDGHLYSIYSHEPPIVTIQAGQTTSIILNLEAPPNNLRQVTIQGQMSLHYGYPICFYPYPCYGSYEQTKIFPVFESRPLNPNSQTQRVEISNCVNDHVSGKIIMDLSLLQDNSVEISAVTELYPDVSDIFESSSCYEQDDKIAGPTDYYSIPPDASTYIEGPTVQVTFEGSEHWVQANLTVTNELMP